MKKITLIFAFLTFLSYVAISQTPQLTWQFANYEVINAGAQLQFDVEVKADVGTSFHRDLQVYFNYNTAGFVPDVVAGGNITVTPLTLMDNYYFVVNTADNTSSKVAIITEATNEMTESGSATYFNLMPSTFTGLLRITMDITDNTAFAGIDFDEALMNGGQYYQSTSNYDALKYADPCLYDNDLLTNKLSTLYGNLIYANGASTPLTDCSIDLLDSGVPIDNATSDSNGDYNFSSVDDGTFTLETSSSKTWGGLNMLDVIHTRQYLSGIIAFDALQQKAADVTDGTGTPNMLDVIVMRQRLSGPVPPLWGAPDYVFEVPSATVSGGVGTVNYRGLCAGDPNGSYTPPSK